MSKMDCLQGNRRKEFRLYSDIHVVKPIEASVPDLGRKPLTEVRQNSQYQDDIFPRVPSVSCTTPARTSSGFTCYLFMNKMKELQPISNSLVYLAPP